MPVPKKSTEIDIISLKRGVVTVWILGDTPFYCNRVNEKAKRELLYPRGKLTTAERAVKLKHDPIQEFRDSPYMDRSPDGPTRILMAGTAPKKALATAALDMPTGVAKTKIQRLIYMPAEMIPIYGVPRLSMNIVRQADISRTPDIRSRAKIDRWASCFKIAYAEPLLNDTKVSTLLAASGMICGLGDWRQERGSGSNGLYHLADADDPELLEVVKNGGREAQDAAFKEPICADVETEDLLAWFMAERQRRGTKIVPEEEEGEDELSIPAHLINGGEEAVI